MAITGEMAFRFLHDEGEGFLADIIVAQYTAALVPKLKAAAIRMADIGEKVWLARFALDEMSVPGSQVRDRRELEKLLHPLIEVDTISSPEVISILSILRWNAYAVAASPPRKMHMIIQMRVGPDIENPDEDFYVEWHHLMATNWIVAAADKHKGSMSRHNVIKPVVVELAPRRKPRVLPAAMSLEAWEEGSVHAMEAPDPRLTKH